MISSDKLLYRIALTQIKGVGDILSKMLLQVVGDEEEIFRSSRKSLLSIQGLPSKLANEILNPEVLAKAEKELAFIEKNNIRTYFINDDDYPSRLKECTDSPILFYFKGNADLNEKKIVSIVGTRNSSAYGNEFCDRFVEEIAAKTSDLLIVSGLAYGIDIQAHKAALKQKIPTVGVLAHGLDRIYPNSHRSIAIDMLNNGGLFTDFPSDTDPDRFNFVRRNRIVAGLADAVIVVESAKKGGSLITADIAGSYCRDVFAVPGKITDSKSIGCNNLIADHKADLLLSTEYFLQQMGWDTETVKKRKAPKQQQLFIDLTKEEHSIIEILSGIESLHVDQLALQAQIPVYQLFPILLELELKNVIKNLPGNFYSLTD